MEKLVNCQGKNSREDDVCCFASLPVIFRPLVSEGLEAE